MSSIGDYTLQAFKTRNYGLHILLLCIANVF